ncbi:MAG: hypothetical protein ACOYOQ_00585 [Microthrixaceae bacterium]
MSAPCVVICLRHRLLGRFGGRWHQHAMKPIGEMDGKDDRLLMQLNDGQITLGRWWTVSTYRGEMPDE